MLSFLLGFIWLQDWRKCEVFSCNRVTFVRVFVCISLENCFTNALFWGKRTLYNDLFEVHESLLMIQFVLCGGQSAYSTRSNCYCSTSIFRRA